MRYKRLVSRQLQPNIFFALSRASFSLVDVPGSVRTSLYFTSPVLNRKQLSCHKIPAEWANVTLALRRRRTYVRILPGMSHYVLGNTRHLTHII